MVNPKYAHKCAKCGSRHNSSVMNGRWMDVSCEACGEQIGTFAHMQPAPPSIGMALLISGGIALLIVIGVIRVIRGLW